MVLGLGLWGLGPGLDNYSQVDIQNIICPFSHCQAHAQFQYQVRFGYVFGRPLPDDHAGVEAPPEQELAGGHDVVIRTQTGAGNIY